jgi:hypothetical protein
MFRVNKRRLVSKVRSFYKKQGPKTPTHLMLYLGVLPSTYGALKQMFPELFEYIDAKNKAYLLDRGFEDKAFIKDFYEKSYQETESLSIEITTYEN